VLGTQPLPGWRNRLLLSLALLFTGIVLVSLGTAAPSVLLVPNRVWWRFARLLGRVNGRVFLSVFVAVVLTTPVGVAMRVFGVLSGHGPDKLEAVPAAPRGS
jgi:Saxitoxin biosynthesis operon protein SxtJ